MDKKKSIQKVRYVEAVLFIPSILLKIHAAATAETRPVIKCENPQAGLWEKWRPMNHRLPGHLYRASVDSDELNKLRLEP
jgi:hypothetical protein